MSKVLNPQIKNRLHVLCLILPLLLLSVHSFAQLKTISGVVKDESGTPLADVSVVAAKTNTGTKTDASGHYRIAAEQGSSLVFSSVNYETYTLVVDNRTSYDIQLKLVNNDLSDVVVVGYGKQKKVNLVGAVSMVKIDDKTTGRALPNVSSALSGLVPGLSAVQNSGMAGANSAQLIIRGLGTANNASPLVVVDGMPDVDINRVNLNDIESISVLKDATSASVYGSRAANGEPGMMSPARYTSVSSATAQQPRASNSGSTVLPLAGPSNRNPAGESRGQLRRSASSFSASTRAGQRTVTCSFWAGFESFAVRAP